MKFELSPAGERFMTMDRFHEAMNATYGKPSGLDDYLLKAQAMAHDGERVMFEAYCATSTPRPVSSNGSKCRMAVHLLASVGLLPISRWRILRLKEGLRTHAQFSTTTAASWS